MSTILLFREKPIPKAKWYHRQLRTYTRIAFNEYTCTYCNDRINPGDYYEGYVVVRSTREGKRKLEVYRYHRPDCPNDPHREDFEREEERQHEESLKEAQEKPKAFAAAA